MKKDKVVAVGFTEQTYQSLRELCAADNRTMASLVRYIVNRYLRERRGDESA